MVELSLRARAPALHGENTMSNDANDADGLIDPSRRNVLRAAGGAAIGGVAAGALASNTPAFAQTAASPNPGAVSVNRNNAPLGARLQGVQHFGLTVQNMDRAFAFYTEVLGGNEVMRDGDFQGEKIHNTLLTGEEIIARERRVNPRTIGVPDLKGGAQRLDVRFVQFDNVVIELLQYRDAQQPMGSGDSFAEPRDHMSPAYPRSMHICFYIRDDVDFNKFIADLEAESARRGMTQVKANRIVTVTTEAERRAAPMDSNTIKITEGQSNGWSLIYCKGPEGEQLEFVQALGPVKKTFEAAMDARRRILATNRG
jgi:catechol 2,3-dioxygenase-like lactoylglutathione lyase family enzyme